jgi:Fe-S cluster biogenesis protein NfuA
LVKILSKSAADSKPVQSNGITNKINEVLDSKIRPAVARDGEDITFKSYTDGVVTVELKGSCSGCPSSIMTLKQGVQNLFCHYIPEVKSVEAI